MWQSNATFFRSRVCAMAWRFHAVDATCFRSRVCAMAWRSHAIDAMLSLWPRWLDGVNNLTHWLIPHGPAQGVVVQIDERQVPLRNL